MSVGAEGRGSPDTGPDSLSEQDVFSILSNDRRRQALHYLMQDDVEEERTIREISRQVAAWENGVPVDELTSQQRRRVHIALQQSHLPRMDESDIVDYAPSRGTVTLSENARDLEVYLDVVRGNEISWSQFYFGLSALAAGVLAVAHVDLFPFDVLPDPFWVVLVVAGFLVTSGVHLRYDRNNRLGAAGPPPAAVDRTENE